MSEIHDLQQQLEQKRVPIEDLVLDQPMQVEVQPNSVLLWNNVGVHVYWSPPSGKGRWAKGSVGVWIYDKHSTFKRLSDIEPQREYFLRYWKCRDKNAKKYIQRAIEVAEKVACLRSAGWTVALKTITVGGYVRCKTALVNPITNEEFNASDWLRKIDRIPHPTEDALQIANALPVKAPTIPQTVQQVAAELAQQQVQTEVNLLISRYQHLGTEKLVEVIENTSASEHQNLLQAAEKFYQQKSLPA